MPKRGLKLHGKMLLADGVTAIVGSINLALGSFDSRRELAIEVHDAAVVDRLHTIVKLDNENSHPLDLSDDGLTADLENREEDASSIRSSRGPRRSPDRSETGRRP